MNSRDEYSLFDSLSSRSKCSVLAWLFIYAATHPEEIAPEWRGRIFNPSHRMTRHMPNL